ncbi:MAG TPA: CehA/McbA family metallohydrolase [Bryobacteraceae bacterium]|nr:CehA/McbA family metallohydrolase [Bryobacteraceae bacterium]
MAFLVITLAAVAEPQFVIRVRNPQPARYYLTDSDGKVWMPGGAVVYEKRGEKHFVTGNGFEIRLPPGAYTLVAERGPEYRPFQATIEGRAGEQKIVPVEVARWIDMNRQGWFSGDLHNHRRPEEMPLLLLAEDLNLAPTIADWVWDDGQVSNPPDTTDAVRQVDRTHVYSLLDKEVERLKNGPGAVDLLGLRSPIPFEGYLLYPPNDTFARKAHAQGGWVDAEKIVWRDVVALVALGHVDFAGIVFNHFNRQDVETETDEWGMIPKSRPEFNTPAGMPLWAMEVYYRFLNCGFRLPASAGSAAGVKAAPLGYNRVYVKPRGPFAYDTWFRALKEGRSFATNGPMIFLTVDGKEPGDVLRFSENAARRVKVHVGASSANTMNRLEVLFKGKTIRTVTGAGRLTADFTTSVAETGWFAARAFEKPDRTIRFAHTSPVYVEFSGDRGIVGQDAQFFVDWIDREMTFYKNAPGFRQASHRAAMVALFSSARKIFVELGRM